MPSKYMVSLVLDKETIAIWEGLPVGERSSRIRASLKDAELAWGQDNLIKALRGQIKQLKKQVDHARWGEEE